MTRCGNTLRFVPGQPTQGNMSAFTGQFMIVKERFMSSAKDSLDFEKIVQDGGLEAQTGRYHFRFLCLCLPEVVPEALCLRVVCPPDFSVM